jgi:hypothetical protein
VTAREQIVSFQFWSLMKWTLLRRLKQLELRKHASPPLIFRFGLLKRLPEDYRGERHVVTVSRESTNSPLSELCEFEERPGPAPPGIEDNCIKIYFSELEMLF